MSHTHTQLKALAAVTLSAFALSACESPEQKEVRYDQIEQIVDTSLNKCFVDGNAQSYRARLTDDLRYTTSNTLSMVIDNGITVCADQRLGEQDRSGKLIRGIYYNQDSQKTISLYDNGKDIYTSPLSKFAHAVDRDKDIAQQPIVYAARYSTGKSSTIRLRDSDHFSQRAIKANPQLATPPLKTR